MLIIFDLDDTLIDTSGCITPFKLQESLKRLIASGVSTPEFNKAYAELLELNQKSARSVDAVSLFASKWKATQKQMDAAVAELMAPLPESFRICMTPNAKEMIEWCRKKGSIAIVTGGDPSFQKEKLKKAGIDTRLFSMISIPEDSVKKPHYQALQTKFSLSSKEIWVCGDRIEMDLKPAFELGFQTVHMRWGRGARLASEKWVDHSISDLSELKEIIR